MLLLDLQALLVRRLSSQDSTGTSVNEDAIFNEVLGIRSAYKKEWGPLPKGTTRSQIKSVHMENIQLKEKVIQQEKIIQNL